jgi:hypothetical protein
MALIRSIATLVIWVAAVPVFGQELPPPAYRHPPLCIVEVEYLSAQELDRRCRSFGLKRPNGLPITACTAGCIRYTADPCVQAMERPQDRWARLDCHENGRTNGWPY